MEIKIADEVWVAVAEMTKQDPEAKSFVQVEIVARVISNNLVGRLRAGVNPHVQRHLVADKVPNPGTYRMLMSDPPGGRRRRLWRPSDQPHNAPGRGGKSKPAIADIPDPLKGRVRDLLEWHEKWIT